MNKDKEALTRAVEMHREFAALDTSLFLEFELVDNIWSRPYGDHSIYWNTDDNKEDLEGECGETYGIEAYRGPLYEDDEYLLTLGDNGCGDKSYYLFLKDKEVVFE